MKQDVGTFSPGVHQEIAALTETLHRTEARLAKITEGQVDAVSDGEGRALLLRRAQELLRGSEAAKQGAMLSELKTVEESLRATAELLTAVFAGTPDLVFVKDLQSRYLLCNEAMARFAGRAIHEIVGQGPDDLYNAQTAAIMKMGDRRVMEGGVAVNYEEVITGANQTRTVLTTKVPYRNADGEVIGVIGIARDITDRKQAELERDRERDALRRSQALLGMSGRLARVGGWSVELVTRKVTWTDGQAALHDEPAGFSPILKQEFSYFLPVHEAMIRAAFDQCVEVGTPFDVEYEITTARGRGMWVRAIGEAVRNEDGMIVRVQGAMQDLSERKMAEKQALKARQQLELLQASVSQLNDMVLIAEVVAGDDELRIVFVNDALLRNTGYTREELLGRSPRLLHGDQTGHRRLDRQRAAGAGFEPIHVELVNYRKNGEPFWVDLDVVPFSVDGAGDSHFVSVMRDITERKRDQDALREMNADLEARVSARTAELTLAREEAEQANRAKSSFLAAMSHEIRTPMNGVIGMVDVLNQTSLRGFQVEMVDLIRDSAFSLLKIIDDILDFSKIEAGKLSVLNEPVDLGDIVEKICGMLDAMAVKAGVHLYVFIDPMIPAGLSGDETRLRQVLINLMSNAIKFSAGNETPGQVSMRVTMVEQQPGSVTVEFCVADNGIGIDPATLATLFQPFTQADVSTTRRFGGTGLGLSISGMLVRLMDGEISVRSALGEGSSFTVRLALETVTASPPAAALLPPLRNVRCRIVGSLLPFASDLERYLRHAGAHVESSPDLAAAAAAVRSKGLCLWLVLPGEEVPGLDELRALAGSHPDSEIRFIVFDHGTRRRPRTEAPDCVTIDVEMLLRRTLFRTLLMAAGQMQDGTWDDDLDETRQSARGRLREESRSAGRLVLVAEDNETNRKVIGHQLQLLGVAAEFAVNGCEALERWRSGDFALLLTDLHMPLMDGYALTAAIRAEEPPGCHAPIIALTANALRDEEMRCRAAGVDAFLTKPVRMHQLKSSIDTWINAGSAQKALRNPRAGAASGSPVDLDVLTDLIGNDPTVVCEVLQAFKTSAAESSAQLSDGLSSGRPQAMADAAHKLKSGARSIGADRLGAICAELESAAEAGRWTEVNTLLPLFETELDAVRRFLDARDAEES